MAKKLIDQAKDLGFDAVKFQKEIPISPHQKSKKQIIRSTPWGEMSYLNYKRIEFDLKQYKEIDRYCKKEKLYGLHLHGI